MASVIEVTEVDVESGEETVRPATEDEQTAWRQQIAAATAQAAAADTAASEQKDATDRLQAVRAKALLVHDGDATFTAGEVQKIVAALVLRITR